MPHRFSVSQWWSLVETYRPTWLNVVPTIIAYLVNGPELTAAQAAACRGVRFARSASAPLPPEHHRAFEARFGISVLEAMGLTECASVAFANPLDPRLRKIGSPGRPLGMDARVVAPDGALRDDGESGEIELRGDNVMHGYHKDPDATARDAARRRVARHGRPRLSRRRRLLFHHGPPEGAHHQGRREHRAARDRRGAAEAPGGAGGGGGRHSRPRLRSGDPGLRRAEGGRRVHGGGSARALPGRARPRTRRRRCSASSRSCRKVRRARCSG